MSSLKFFSALGIATLENWLERLGESRLLALEVSVLRSHVLGDGAGDKLGSHEAPLRTAGRTLALYK